MPTEAALEGAKQRFRHPPKVRLFDIAILHVVGDAIRENVLDLYAIHAEAVVFQEPASFPPGIGVGHRTAGLCFGVFSHQLREFPEASFAFSQQDASHFVRPTMVDHDFEDRTRTGVVAELAEDSLRVGRVVDDAKGIDEVVRLDREKGRKLLGVARTKTNALLQAENGSALARDLHGLFREVDGGDVGAGAGEVDGVGADTTADFQNFLPAPSGEFGKGGDVILDEILPGFHLVEIFPGADGSGGVADITRPRVPIIADAADFDLGEGHGESIAEVTETGS